MGRVLDVYHKSGNNYINFNDAEIGGEVKLTIPGAEGSVKIDSLIELDAEVKPGMWQGKQFLKVMKLNKEEKK